MKRKRKRVGEDDGLLQRGMVAEIALGTGIGVAPVFGGLTEEGDWVKAEMLKTETLT